MYNDKLCVSQKDWERAGLTKAMLYSDVKRGDAAFACRRHGGESLVELASIRRQDRREALTALLGDPKGVMAAHIERDGGAMAYYTSYRTEAGMPLGSEMVERCVNRATLLGSLTRYLEQRSSAMRRYGKTLNRREWLQEALVMWSEWQRECPCGEISNAKTLDRLLRAWEKEGYRSCISGKVGNDNSRKVSASCERLVMALWRTADKPFVKEVYARYIAFVDGERELYDRESGMLFRPQDFRHKDRSLLISETTVWRILKDVVNETAVYADRNGNFDYQNSRRPKHVRRVGQWSLSKVSMDDVALSRQTVRGWVYKYIAVDVVSGYYFRPAYVVGKPTADTVVESMRNMLCELRELGLPTPGELEVEHHLMQDIEWLGEVFPMVRFCKSATEKRAEHNIRQLKYGAAKRAGHTIGRWYAKSEAYKAVRNKVEGDYEIAGSGKGVGGLQPQTVVADDLNDIEAHNNSLHPNQKRYPGMTRREVLIQMANPELKTLEERYLLRWIGNRTATSLTNNNYCLVQGERMALKDFGTLRRLAPNSRKVEAYWLPEADGSVERCYLYQGESYIGEAENMEQWRYNENAIERTAEEEMKMLWQEKRVAQFDRMMREERAQVPQVGMVEKDSGRWDVERVEVIAETEQPRNYEGDENEPTTAKDWGRLAIESL
ncbi:MAG: hypothetical protein KBT04_05910 [Bacteroidales bacterium]|nr:hypothetical protein [Candidatus Colimorpha onthohippi]